MEGEKIEGKDFKLRKFLKTLVKFSLMPPFQTFTAVLQEKKFLTEDVLLLSFSSPPEFTFQAGQFMTIVLERKEEKEGRENGEKKVRSYSILNPPSERGKVDFCVKIIPGGFASEIFLKAVIGDTFVMKGPLGHFVFDISGEKEQWFIGAGTGLAPFYSMILEYLPKRPDLQFRLLIGFRYLKNVLFQEKFQELEKKFPNFKYFLTLSKEESTAEKGREIREGKVLRGRVQQHLPVSIQGKTFYICGLKDLVLETRAELIKKGVLPEKIKFERYN